MKVLRMPSGNQAEVNMVNISGCPCALDTDYASEFRMFDKSPIPIEIFVPDGTLIYINQALLVLIGIPDASLILGKYNLLEDPKCNVELGMGDGIRKAFAGKAATWNDFPLLLQDLVDCGLMGEKVYEKAYMDYHIYPVMDGGKVLYVVCEFIIKNVYKGNPDVVKTIEYIEGHCFEPFNPNEIAKVVSMSLRNLQILFKQHTRMTMGEYYRNCLIGHLKKKLADKSLSIAEAFAVCGKDNRGTITKYFKKITGMTPTEYRNSII